MLRWAVRSDEMADSWTRNLRDASDVLRRARNPAELAKALVPNQWLARKVLNDDMADAAGTTPTDVAEALRKKRPEERIALWLWENAARILEDKPLAR